MDYRQAAAFRAAVCDPSGGVAGTYRPGYRDVVSGSQQAQIWVSPNARGRVLELAGEHGIELDSVNRWTARVAYDRTEIVSTEIPAEAVAAAFSRVMLAWDADLAAGRPLPGQSEAYAQVSALEQVLTVTAAGYFLRGLAEALAVQAEPDLIGRPADGFGSNPTLPDPTHELLSVLLGDTLTGIPSSHRSGELSTLTSLARAALRQAELVAVARAESGTRLERVPRPERRIATRAVRRSSAMPPIPERS